MSKKTTMVVQNGYELAFVPQAVTQIPESLQTSLPSIELLERELSGFQHD